MVGFNPCFNGYSTLTPFVVPKMVGGTQKCFNPCFNGYSTLTFLKRLQLDSFHVSILVLMDTLL